MHIQSRNKADAQYCLQSQPIKSHLYYRKKDIVLLLGAITQAETGLCMCNPDVNEPFQQT